MSKIVKCRPKISDLKWFRYKPSQKKCSTMKHRLSVKRNNMGKLRCKHNLKQMKSKWLVGVSIQGYGCSLAVGLGVPIPLLKQSEAPIPRENNQSSLPLLSYTGALRHAPNHMRLKVHRQLKRLLWGKGHIPIQMPP